MDDVRDKQFDVAPAAVVEYSYLALSHGADAVKTLRFAVKESQTCRFDAVLRLIRTAIGDKQEYTLLDVGCGLGDFLPYLKKEFHAPKVYAGVDPAPPVIQAIPPALLEEFPQASFKVGTVFDVEEVRPASLFDVVVGIGCFGEKEPTWAHGVQLKMVQRSFEKMYRLSNGVAVMTAHSTYKQNPRACEFLVDPWGLGAWAHDTLTERVVLDHQEMPHEVFLAAYRGASKWKLAYEVAKAQGK